MDLFDSDSSSGSPPRANEAQATRDARLERIRLKRKVEPRRIEAQAQLEAPSSPTTPSFSPSVPFVSDEAYLAERLARKELHASVVKAERAPTPSFHLTHVPVEALCHVTEWLSGDDIACLWFTGDSMLQRKLQRAVRRIEVALSRPTRNNSNRVSVPLLSHLTSLETVIFVPRKNGTFDSNPLIMILDLSVVPRSLKHLQIRIPITIRTFTKRPEGRADFFDWKELMPELRFFDISETSVGVYEDMAPWMPQFLRTLRFTSTGKIDQEFIDALPFLNLEEFSLHAETSYPPRSIENSITLPKELLRLTWTYPWSSLAELPPRLQELVLSAAFPRNPYAGGDENNGPTHKLPLWIRAFALPDLRRLELHANESTPVNYGRAVCTFDTFGMFSTLPQKLTILIINFTPNLDSIDRLVSIDCITHLPATLLELTLAGFDVPLAGLETLPCDNLRRLSIFERGQPSYPSKPGKKVSAGDRYRVGRRMTRGCGLFAGTDAECNDLGGAGQGGNSPSELFLMHGAPSPDEPNITPEERKNRLERLNAISKLYPSVVNSLPRSLVALHIPHAHLYALEYLGPHTWPTSLGELHVGEVPISYVPQLPRSLFSLDCIFAHSNRNNRRRVDDEDEFEEDDSSMASSAYSSAPHGSDAPNAREDHHSGISSVSGDSAMLVAEETPSHDSLLPPLLHRLRCSIPSAMDLYASLPLPKKLAQLDIAVEDQFRHPELPNEWSSLLPPTLHSLAIAGISSLFNDIWFDNLPLATLREMQIDFTGVCPLRSLDVLPPLLSRFILRTGKILNFHQEEVLPSTLEYLRLYAPDGNFRSKVYLHKPPTPEPEEPSDSQPSSSDYDF